MDKESLLDKYNISFDVFYGDPSKPIKCMTSGMENRSLLNLYIRAPDLSYQDYCKLIVGVVAETMLRGTTYSTKYTYAMSRKDTGEIGYIFSLEDNEVVNPERMIFQDVLEVVVEWARPVRYKNKVYLFDPTRKEWREFQ